MGSSGRASEVSGRASEVSGRSKKEDLSSTIVTSKSGHVEDTMVTKLASRISCWSKLKRVVSYVMRFVNVCRKIKVMNAHLSVKELDDAEKVIIKDVQKRHFEAEMQEIMKHGTVQAHKSFNRSSRSQVKYLNPVVDDDGVLRVGGRIGKSSMFHYFLH